MGMCNPSRSTTVSSTTKVIMANGDLWEFTGPVGTTQVLQRGATGCFLCHADDMEFDDYITAVGTSEELRPGGLYFVLPQSMLKRRLQPEEMAALAVKASAALAKGGVAAAFGDGMGGEEVDRRRVVPVRAFSVGSAGQQGRARRSGKGSNFTSILGAIAE